MKDPRVRALLLTLVIMIGASAPGVQKVNQALPSIVYLFSSFRGNGDGLHLAWSADGLKWTALAEDRVLLQPAVGGKLMRDPFILQGPDGIFRMVWTSGWYERVIGYASSKDLVHWSEQRAIPVMEHEPAARNCWAPEMAYDPAKRQYIIFWATTIPGRLPDTDAAGDNGLNHRMYCTTTRDFETFTPAKLFFDPGYSVIDATMVHANGRYHLVYKEETLKPVKKNLRVASGDSIEGPFKETSEPFTPSWVEGPSVLKIGGRFVVYFDMYTTRKYGAMQSGDLRTWEDISAQLTLPPGTKHGTGFAVNRSVLATLLAHGQAGNPPSASQVGLSPGMARITTSLDADWRFFRGETAGAEEPSFDDTKWRALSVPHDWSIEGPFDAKNTTGGAGGFLPAGIGWYRKHFSLPVEYARRRIFVEFDGVMANSDVWINGVHLGKRPYGYVSFSYELTRNLNFGGNQPNILAVRADNSGQRASRWYSGAGIYRHVRLVIADPVHAVQWETFVTTPKVDAAETTVHVRSSIINQSEAPRDVSLQVMIISPEGRSVGTVNSPVQKIAPGQSMDFAQGLSVRYPKLWDLEHPNLYSAHLLVTSGGSVLDDETVAFGIRDARFEPGTGFALNGKHVKIKGVCIHHDGGAFGAAVPLGVWEYRLRQLRTLGVNAIRTAHNPPAPEFLDLCDRMGFLVMDEMFDCWTVAKNPYDYHLSFNEWSKIDTRDTVRRDRNHPSIVLYSAGNEIRDTPNAEPARKILAGLVEVFHQNDPTRPVTQGLFRPNVSHDYDNGLADLLDVIGTNYRDSELLAAYQAKPTRKIVGTEQRHDLPTWLAARDNLPHAGQFLWSGIDYLGESPNWPVIAAASGLLDRTGMIKPMAWERQSWWIDHPVVHVVRLIDPAKVTSVDPGFEPLVRRQAQFADWAPPDQSPHEETVEAYSNCEEVELFLNGKSLGTKPRNADDSARVWKVAYEAGLLRAVGRNQGAAMASHELRTAGKAARIVLLANRNKLSPSWDDVCFVEAVVVDQNGVVVPGAANSIAFMTTSPGFVAAVDSGNNSSSEPFQALKRRAYQGRCIAIIKANRPSGRITLSASAPGLTGSAITIEAIALEKK